MTDKQKFLCKIHNYSPYLTLVHMSTKKIGDNARFKINNNKNFGYAHHYLQEEGSVSFKVLSKGDDASQIFNGSSKRFVTICTEEYYYSVWYWIDGKWKVACKNVRKRWNENINILNIW